jgi:membrane fusion protein, heavy metal efflux system
MKKSSRSPWAIPAALQVAIVVVIFGVASIVMFVAPSMAQHDPVSDAATPAPLASGFFRVSDADWSTLTSAPVRVVDFPQVDQTNGTIAAADDATTLVFSPFTGLVTRVFATVGDHVTAGQPLFAIEGGEYAQAENDLQAAQQALRSAQVQLRVTALNRSHLLALERVGGAASKDVAQSAADLAAAQATVRNDETAVGLVRSRLRVLGLSDAAIDRLAQEKPATSTLGTSVIVPAPASGTVTQRGVGVGQNVDSAANGSSDPLLTITDLSRVFLVAAVPETAIGRVHLGDPVAVRMLAFPGRTFSAHVKYIAPTLDANTHRIFVRAEIDSSDGALKPGMFGTMRITTGPPLRAVGVPESAVIYEGDTARVWVAGPHETLALRYLRVGPTVDGMVPVLAGLHAGERIVTSGSVFIDRALLGGD